jgi:predicted membrane metal-binding protein
MNQQPRWVYILAGVAVILLAFRFLFVFRLLFLVVLLAAGVGFLGYFIYTYWKSKQEDAAFSGTVEGRIQAQLEECRTLQKQNQQDLNDIRNSIQDLEKGTKGVPQLSAANRSESDKLLAAFYREKKLRETKASFFETAQQRLESLLKNHRLEQQLNEKRQKLLELQEDKYEELAELEELRYNLVGDAAYLDTIDELSQEMRESKSYEQASGLQEKLEEMTAKLKNM